MTQDQNPKSPSISPDRLLRGVLTKLGDTLDRVTGRRYTPSSSLATSELSERIKKLLDTEARQTEGKGKVVPHHIILKMQWDKFATDDSTTLDSLRDELLIATIDHINDSTYYIYAPVDIEIKPDYFTEGVKLIASFDSIFTSPENEAEMNVTVPSFKPGVLIPDALPEPPKPPRIELTATFDVPGGTKLIKAVFPDNGRLSVGRTVENAVRVDDVSVSKHHAVIAVTDGDSLSVADTGSTNGTFKNGERIAYGKAVEFTEADKISFGTVSVSFKVELTAPEIAPPADENIASADETRGFTITYDDGVKTGTNEDRSDQ